MTEMLPGCHARFVHSDTMTVAHWKIDAGGEIPPHTHPHEQIVNLLEGTFEMRVGDDVFTMAPGDSVIVPGGVEHSALARTDVRCIDVFHPARDDYRI
ncbi:cupin domain-containing protein [Sphaerisporangium album]|nr:cupin domain-containing protein [Sphaerisporangium album]